MWPLYELLHYGYRIRGKKSIGGIVLVGMGRTDRSNDAFQQVTEDALQLIKTHDPRRFRCLQRELTYIVNGILPTYGKYIRQTRSCEIDFDKYKVRRGMEHYDWYLAYYASVIVHEATHGRLHSLGIPYNKHTRSRIERLCHCEQKRFARHLPPVYDYTTLISEFNEADWHPSWNTTFRQKLEWIVKQIPDIFSK